MFPFWKELSTNLDDLAANRARMVDEQLRQRGVCDERVLAAMAKVPRERFLGSEFQREAYGDGPLPIGSGQTISQPLMVAMMIELLNVQPTDRVLEVGTGTGYEAGILAELAAQVWTIERQPALAERAREILNELGYGNVRVFCGDGSQGLAEHAPFDKIIVAAGAPQAPPSLLAQLADGGTLVVPVGDRVEQQVVMVRKSGGEITTSRHSLCCFVPLIGIEGWSG